MQNFCFYLLLVYRVAGVVCYFDCFLIQNQICIMFDMQRLHVFLYVHNWNKEWVMCAYYQYAHDLFEDAVLMVWLRESYELCYAIHSSAN